MKSAAFQSIIPAKAGIQGRVRSGCFFGPGLLLSQEHNVVCAEYAA